MDLLESNTQTENIRHVAEIAVQMLPVLKMKI